MSSRLVSQQGRMYARVIMKEKCSFSELGWAELSPRLSKTFEEWEGPLLVSGVTSLCVVNHFKIH